jgi:hypothetical protein
MAEPVGRGKTVMTASGIIATGLALYAVAGAIAALAFVTFGLSQVLHPPMPATLGARILILPGAFALWPYVLIRRCKARSAP